MITIPSKETAARELRLAQSKLSKALLALRPVYGIENASDEWTELYYTSYSFGSFTKKAAKFAKAHPDAYGAIELLVKEVSNAFAVLDQARATEKTRLEEKRAARAAKSSKKEELGVDLAAKSEGKATEATYKLLRAALADLQQKLAAAIVSSMRQERAAIISALARNNNDAALTYPAYEYRSAKVRPGEIGSTPMFFWKYFEKVSESRHETRVDIRRSFDHSKFIISEAADKADEIVASYSAKLAGKIDGATEGRKIERVEHRLGGLNIWEFSFIHAFEAGDEVREQVWKTKVIWNRSCLGKNFNQWPTTRYA